MNLFVHLSVVHERQESALERRNVDWEIKVSPLSILLPHFKAVFKDAIDYSADSIRRFNHMRYILLLLNGVLLLFEANVFLSQNQLSAVISLYHELLLSLELCSVIFSFFI